MPNNVAFSPEILKKIRKKGFKDSVTYLTACPLLYAIVDVVDPFLPQHVCDFYYNSTYYNTRVILGTIGDGDHTIRMNVTDDLRALSLPIKNEYFCLPSIDECRVVLENLNYDFDIQENHNIPRMHLPTTWKFLTGVLGKCVTHKMRIPEQLNSFGYITFYVSSRISC
ncbi:unnamed protein product [Lactuca virosa]|uniref:Uncharacterized protein n=1 Tax=Lactuca virosa TaxID=75947 RepID=A0AAU9LF94_9ASTR|nr:unnamed protein product [Lactuca virosa]CAH1412096.1 unnamed protein product [Lactuca virosa]